MPHPGPVRPRHHRTRRSRFGALLSPLLILLLTANATADADDAAVEAQAPKLAIVIDDVGYNLHRAEEIMALPVELTLGMLPYAPFAQQIAERASLNGREIILHQPMEAVDTGKQEPGTLKLAMSAEHFDAQFTDALAQLPNVTGVNNHTGSLLTAHRLPMEWLMAGIARRGLFFLDSRTTPHSVAEHTARAHAVPTIRRDVFLDHVRTPDHIEAAFERGLAIARRRGHAVVIAHPYAMTVRFLEEKLASLPEDVRLSTLSELVEEPERLKAPVDQKALVLLGSPGSPNISLGQ